MKLCLPVTWEDIPVKSQLHEHTNVSCTSTMPVNISNWIGKIPRGLNCIQRPMDNREKLGAGDVVFTGEENNDWLSSSKLSYIETIYK